MNTLFTDEWYLKQVNECNITNRGLFFLAKSLEQMSLCNIVYFCKGGKITEDVVLNTLQQPLMDWILFTRSNFNG